jgi:hypothetical protein
MCGSRGRGEKMFLRLMKFVRFVKFQRFNTFNEFKRLEAFFVFGFLTLLSFLNFRMLTLPSPFGGRVGDGGFPLFTHPALITTIFHFIPNLLPFFTPSKRPVANHTNLFR